MRRILKYALIAGFALIISIFGINRMPQLLTIFVLGAGCVCFIARKIDKNMRAIIIAFFLTAFLLQVSISLFMYNQTVDTKYYGFSYKGDDYVYGDFGTIVGDLWRQGIFPSLKKLEYYNLVGERADVKPYQLYSACIFYLFGARAGQILLIINCFLHAIIIIPVYFICKNLKIRNNILTPMLLLFLFWPSTLYWSFFNFKEPMMIFTLFVIFSLAMKERKNLLDITFLLGLSFILCQLKQYLIIVFPAVFFYLFALWKWRYKNVAILCVLSLLILGNLLFGPFLSNLHTVLRYMPGAFWGIRHSSYFTNTCYFVNLITYTYPRTLLYFPLGLLATLFLPFLLKPIALFHVVANIESMAWWCLIPFLISGIWISMRRELKKTFIILVMFFYWLILLALTQGNMGTLLRQKAIIYYIGFIFVSLAIDRALGRERSLGEQ